MQGYTTTDDSEAAYLVSQQDEFDEHEYLELENRSKRRQYEANKAAKVGTKIECPCCSRRFKKKSYQHAFCRNKGRGNCKDYFWNTTNERRLERAKIFNQ